jgi:hypothetical protein
MLSFFGVKSGPKKKKSRFNARNNWMIVRKLNSQRCGQHFLIQNTESGEVLMKKTVFKDEDSKAKQLEKNLKIKMRDQHNHTLHLHDYDVDIQQDFCSKVYYFSIYYDYPEKDLQLMLTNQLHSKGSFSGEHLLKIAYNTLSGLIHLQSLSKNRDSGLLQLDRVYYNSDTNNYCVLENINDIRIFDFYFNLTINRNKFAIFSPNCIKKKPLINKKFDLSKIDCFNLGIILLCFGVNELPQIFYKKNYKEINVPLLEAKKLIFTEKYKDFQFLCDIIVDLLTIDVNLRPSLKEILRKYPKNTKLKEYQASSKSINMRSSIKSKTNVNFPELSKNLYPNSKLNIQKMLINF